MTLMTKMLKDKNKTVSTFERATLPHYPYGSRLLNSDERFWVSMGTTNEVMIFILADELPNKTSLKDIFSGLHVFIDPRFVPARIVIQLEDETILDKFIKVIEYISLESRNINDNDLYYFVVNKLYEWSAFLKPKRDGISDSELIGIFGELYVLYEYYLPKFGSELFTEYFLGPLGAPQDFGGVKISLEVKTTTQKSPLFLNITSLTQLDRPENESAIAQIQVDKSNKGFSCKSLVIKIEESLINQHLALMHFKKTISKKLENATEQQLNLNFEIAHERCWCIKEGFPKLTTKTVPQGIVKAEYTIEIKWLDDFEIMGGIKEFLDG